MRLLSISLLLLVVCSIAIDARRVRVRTRPVDEDQSEEAIAPRVQYYTATDPNEQEAEPQQHRGIVLVSSDDYNGLYGQQAPGRSVVHDNYIASRSSPAPPKQQILRQKEPTKVPPVQTLRNYNKVNDDGSFTFGYEAADGSFKEETRGTDCVVRGKYGYIDPDGNKREFTYVSGNPCDPNEPDDSDDRHQQEDEKEDDGPANYPKSFPIRPTARPTPHPTRPPVTVFQNNYDQNEEQTDEEDEPEPLQVLRPQTRPQPRPHIIQQHRQPSVTYVQQPEIQRPLYLPQQTTPSTVYYHQSNSPVSITPRPTTTKTQLPATTYRPQLLHVGVTPRPKDISTPSHSVSTIYSTSTPSPLSQTARTPSGSIDFNAEFQKFAQENNIVASTPSSFIKSTTAEKNKATSASPSRFTGSEPIYASELVFDPSSGQYNTQLFQNLPQTAGEFTLNHRIQPYVAQQNPRLVSLQQLQHQSPLYRNIHQQSPQPTPTPLAPRAPTPTPSQQFYQQQQAEIQFQNSQQLFAQQQRARAQNAQRAAGAPPHFVPSPQQAAPQQFYYIQPTINSQLSSGQIDAFLRGHNIQI